jgi:hypothetical protein
LVFQQYRPSFSPSILKPQIRNLDVGIKEKFHGVMNGGLIKGVRLKISWSNNCPEK